MKLLYKQYKWLFIVGVIMFTSHMSLANTYKQSAQSASWGYQPLYASETAYNLSTDIQPTYQFKSTSPYSSIIGSEEDNSYLGIARRTSSWGWNDEDPEDNPIGVLDDLTPIGDVLLPLLLCAIAFALYCSVRRRQKENLHTNS